MNWIPILIVLIVLSISGLFFTVYMDYRAHRQNFPPDFVEEEDDEDY